MFVKEITKRYDGKAVVDGVSFEIPKGKVLSLIGPNGAGKSTVMGMLSRLIARDSGLVDFEGTEITRWKSRELSKRLAILTQANNVQMKLTVRELVAFGRFPYSGGRLTQEDNEIIDRAIAYMELGDFEEQFIDELSGGQRQRAYIAMVIAQDTEYILLDEPTNNLDIYHATNLMRIVRRLCDELGKTVILVLHEINYAAFYSDYICAFVDGKIAKFGTVQEVITKENLSDMQAIGSVMTFAVNGILLGVSSTAVAFFGIYYKLQNFLMMPVNGLGQAAIPVVGFNYGSGQSDRVKQAWKVLLPTGVVFALCGTAVFLLFPAQLLGLFSASDEMLAFGVPALRIISVTFLFAVTTILCGYFASGLGNGVVNMIGGALRQLVVLVPCLWFLIRTMGIDRAWFAFWVSEVIACAYSLWATKKELRNKGK